MLKWLSKSSSYHKLFKLGSKPVNHLQALANLTDEELLKDMPAELSRLADKVKEIAKIGFSSGKNAGKEFFHKIKRQNVSKNIQVFSVAKTENMNNFSCFATTASFDQNNIFPKNSNIEQEKNEDIELSV